MKINKKFFSKIFKYQLSSILISIIVSTSFYFYSINNKKFELDLRINVNKLNYEYYNLNIDSYLFQLKENTSLKLRKYDTKINKKHKLYFGSVRATTNRIDVITLKVMIYGINFENNLEDNYFDKVIQEIQSEYFLTLQNRLSLLESIYDENSKRFNQIVDNYNEDQTNIRLSLQIDPFVNFTIKKNYEIAAIKNILKQKNHINYDYKIVSKDPNILVPTIILLFVSIFLLNFVYGLFLFGRSILIK